MNEHYVFILNSKIYNLNLLLIKSKPMMTRRIKNTQSYIHLYVNEKNKSNNNHKISSIRWQIFYTMKKLFF